MFFTKSVLISVAAATLATAAMAQSASDQGQAAATAAGSLPTYADVGLTWKRWPSLADMERMYPYRAGALGQSRGLAQVACTADDRGRLRGQALHESPQNMYFGRAAVNVMQRARVESVDGRSPAGRTFGYTLRFGDWPTTLVPDRFHPLQAGLRWAKMPEMKRTWQMRGQTKNQLLWATFDCEARTDGSLGCNLWDRSTDDDSFARAALHSMHQSRVVKVGGGSPEGTRFKWTVGVVANSSCKPGSNDDRWEQNTLIHHDSEGVMTPYSQNNYEITPRCLPAMYQVFGDALPAEARVPVRSGG